MREARASGAPWVNLPIPENLVITCPYTERTNDRPSAPQAYQCSIPHFLASLGAQDILIFCIAGSGVHPSRSI